jgi:hypothetical protein
MPPDKVQGVPNGVTLTPVSQPSFWDTYVGRPAGEALDFLNRTSPMIPVPQAPKYNFPEGASFWDRNIKQPVLNATEPVPLIPMSETRITDKPGIIPKLQAAGSAIQNVGARMPENFAKHLGRNMFGLVDAPVQGAAHVIKGIGGNEPEATKAIEGAKSLNPDVFYPKGGLHNLLKSYWAERNSPETLLPRAAADFITMKQFMGGGEPIKIPTLIRENFPSLGSEEGFMGGFGTGENYGMPAKPPIKPEPKLPPERPIPPARPRVEPDYPLISNIPNEKPFDINDFMKNQEGFWNPFNIIKGKGKQTDPSDLTPLDINALDQHTGFGQGNEMQWLNSGKKGPIPINTLKGPFNATGDPDKAFKLYDNPPAPLQFPKRNIEGFGPNNPRPMPEDFADKPKALQNQIVATVPRQNFKPTIVQPDQFTSGFPTERTTEPEPLSFKEMLIKFLRDEGGYTKHPEAAPEAKRVVRGLDFPANLGVNAGGTMKNLGAGGYRILPSQEITPKQVAPSLRGEGLGKGGYRVIPPKTKTQKLSISPIEQQILNALKPSGGRIDFPDNSPYSNYKIIK